MLSSWRKCIYAVYVFPKLNWKYAKSLQRASSSSFIKWPSLFGSKTGAQHEETAVVTLGTPGRSEYYVPRKFVPMTRKALLRRIVEDENLVNSKDRHYFQDLAVHLDKAIAGTFHGVLGELKVWKYPLDSPPPPPPRVRGIINFRSYKGVGLLEGGFNRRRGLIKYFQIAVLIGILGLQLTSSPPCW